MKEPSQWFERDEGQETPTRQRDYYNLSSIRGILNIMTK